MSETQTKMKYIPIARKPIKAENSAVHVIYVTTECNLRCTYCFESEKQHHFTLDEESLTKAVQEAILSDDIRSQTLIVLFGGEPLLNRETWQRCQFVMREAYKRKQNVHFSLNTNGVLLQDTEFLFKFVNDPMVKRGMLTLCVSYDGAGQSLRVDRNGSDEKAQKVITVIQHLSRLSETRGLKYTISYTVNHLNVDCLKLDFYKLCQYKPDRMVYNIAYNDLQESDRDKIQKFIQYVRESSTIPVCHWMCDFCDKCSSAKSTRQYFVNGVMHTVKNDTVQGDFDYF